MKQINVYDGTAKRLDELVDKLNMPEAGVVDYLIDWFNECGGIEFLGEENDENV